MAEAEQDFDYKPGREASDKDSGKEVSWTASEYIDHARGSGWYAMLIVVTLALAAGAYLLKDILAAAIIIALGAVVAMSAKRRPQQLQYTVSDNGLSIGQKSYSYSQFRSFAVIHEGQLSSLVFVPIKRLLPPLSIYFDDNDEDKVLAIVGQHLPLEQRDPDRMDKLTRRLKF
jgi:hypothetical protein